MLGYGRSYIPATHDEVEIKYNVADLIHMLNQLRGNTSQAVFVGHDWGGPIVWSLGMHYPNRCVGIVGMLVPHFKPHLKASSTSAIDIWRAQILDSSNPDGAMQWDYQVHHNDNTDASHRELDADIRASVTAIFQATYERPRDGLWNKFLSTKVEILICSTNRTDI